MKAYCDPIAVIGGDSRIGYLAGALAQDGYTVKTCGLEKFPDLRNALFGGSPTDTVENACAVILPMPVTTDAVTIHAPFSAQAMYIGDILTLLKGKLVLCGHADSVFTDMANSLGVPFIDYSLREDFAIRNAVPTAEGAMEIAMRETRHTIFASRCLVIGYGKIGKVLCERLASFGAHVTASARKCTDFAWIKAKGYTCVETAKIAPILEQFDIVFNTVPARVLGKQALLRLKPNAVIIDLASKPGGIDFDAAELLGVRALHALSLPGKVAPVSAAEILTDTVRTLLEETQAHC